MPEIGSASQSITLFTTTDISTLRSNSDTGTVRMKSIHVDFVVSPNASATKPIAVRFAMHRLHEDVPDANVIYTEGSRVKHEVLTVGRLTDRYYRMWLKEINVEFGYKLLMEMRIVDTGGGAPSIGWVAKWWELRDDAP